jgi:signal transduction histidine kinase
LSKIVPITAHSFKTTLASIASIRGMIHSESGSADNAFLFKRRTSMNTVTTPQEIDHDLRRFFSTTATVGVAPRQVPPLPGQPVSERIRKRFRPRDPRQLDWVLNLRLEERRSERARIARELHDTLLQGFIGASMMLHCAADEMPPDSPGKVSVNRALRRIQGVIDEARVALQGLRSCRPPSGGLEKALTELRDEFVSTNAKVEFRIIVSGGPKELQPAIQKQIYLIGREALWNALCHSQAKKIEAEIEYLPHGLRLLVRDDGCGIDPKILREGRDSHWGLLGMQERAAGIGAKLRIWSKPGDGTEVELLVSL